MCNDLRRQKTGLPSKNGNCYTTAPFSVVSGRRIFRMSSHGVLVGFALAGSICGAWWDSAASAQGQSMPVTAGPQQMIASGVPEAYPSTYPTTTLPTMPMAGSPALPPPNDSLAPAMEASAPYGIPASSLPSDSGGAGNALRLRRHRLLPTA